jgi:hypothetical protein
LSTPAAREIEKFATEVADRLARIEVLRVSEIDGIELSPHTKRPFKAAIYKEALTWRMAELGRDALAAFSGGRYASAMLLTRASIETASAFWYFLKTLRSCGGRDQVKQGVAQLRSTFPDIAFSLAGEVIAEGTTSRHAGKPRRLRKEHWARSARLAGQLPGWESVFSGWSKARFWKK